MLLNIEPLLLLFIFADASCRESVLFWVENMAILALTLLILCSSWRNSWSLELDFPLRDALLEFVLRSTLPFELEEDLRLSSRDEDDVF